jgi:flavodoxin
MKIADSMASALNAQVIDLEEAKDYSIAENDLVGFGSGIYFGKHVASLLEHVDKLPKSDKKAFIFSTRGRNILFQNSYHKFLRKKLMEKGYNVIGQFSSRGFSDYHKIFKIVDGVNKGHPNSEELDAAKAFALKLAGTVQ